MSIISEWDEVECIDLSVPISEEFPVSWPTLPSFRRTILNWFTDYRSPNGQLVRSQGPWYDQYLQMDEHTGTHVDFPIHILAPDELAKTQKQRSIQVSLRDFVGPASVVRATECLDQAPAGVSPRIRLDLFRQWEEEHGRFGTGDIALIDTGYMDRYFAAFPAGHRLLHQPVLIRDVPGWPVPADEVFGFLANRGVKHLGISSPSMGAVDDAIGPHRAGIELGMTYSECLVGLGQLPARGALYVGFPLKISDQSGSPVRAVALCKRPF
jgi:isatin hydrolase